MNAPAEALVERWTQEAAVLRRRGAKDRADLLEALAAEAREAFAEWWTEELTVEEAAAWSGYSRERLRELIRGGQIPDQRPPGAGQGTPVQVRRCDLPRHPLGKRDPAAMPRPQAEGTDEATGTPAERAARRLRGGSG